MRQAPSQVEEKAKQIRASVTSSKFFFACSCLGKVLPFSQRSERATACAIRMQIVKQINFFFAHSRTSD